MHWNISQKEEFSFPMHFRSGMLFIFDQCLLSIKSCQKKWKGKGQPKMLFFIKNSGFEAHQLSAPRKLSSIAPSASSTIPVLRSTIPFLRPTIPVHRPTIPIHLPASSNFSCSYFNHHTTYGIRPTSHFLSLSYFPSEA